ncbi:penicillin acylase family protein [Marinobacter sp.]|uniref:penicillin acylase family protein n=1 Tax=Marinobacter sp. TaxID=50741 RepID=UPI003A949DA2
MTITSIKRKKALWLAAPIAASVALLMGCNDNSESSDGNGKEASSVTIKRDSYGVPHIYAENTYDLYYGYGYALAEDRLFQMEMIRRSVLGTVSEVLGSDYLPLDRSSRSGFSRDSILRQIAALPQEDRDIFEGYADGFNKRIEEVLAKPDSLLPKQFTEFGFAPKSWTGFDVAMLYVGTMAGRYSNSSSEIRNLSVLNNLKQELGDTDGLAMFDQLRWIEDTLAPTTVPRQVGVNSFGNISEAQANPFDEPRTNTNDASAKVASIYDLLAPVSDSILTAHSVQEAAFKGIVAPEDRPVASNLWIVGPNKTSDGSTIFNNGPQFGWFNPAYTYSIGIHGAGYDVTGNTPFALPVVLFGTNNQISWGATAGPLDVNDYYQLQLNPGNQYEYSFDGEYREMDKRSEVIRVKTEDGFEEEVLDIYSSVHGVVTSFDVANNSAYAFKRSWSGFEVQSLMGWIHSMKAQNWEEWLQEAEQVATTINWYYADASGNIGYVSPGYLPVRPANQDIRLPAVGDGSMEWQGFRPFSDVPKVYNPEQGYVTNWNNQSTPGIVGLGDGANWSVVDRVNEFIERIEAKPVLSPEEVWNLNRQTALSDTNARYFIPYIVDSVEGLAPDDPVREAAMQLSQWSMLNTNSDGDGNYNEVAVTIFRKWLPIMYDAVLKDDIPASVYSASAGYPVVTAGGSVRPGQSSKYLYNAFLGANAGVDQTFDFFNGATREEQLTIVRDSLAQAVSELEAELGPERENWLTTAAVHRFSTKNFLGVPQANSSEQLELPTYMNRGTQNHQVSFSGDGDVVMCTVAPPGQSGFVAPDGAKTTHYDDQLELFRDWQCKDEHLTAQAVQDNLESEIRLTINRK